MNDDGPLKIWLRRSQDQEARLTLKRVIGPSAVGLSLAEMRELREAIDMAERELAEQPFSAGGSSQLDLGALVKLKHEVAG